MNALTSALVDYLKRNIPVIIGLVVGAIAGYVYYAEVGCINGSCAITSSPYISTIYGAVLGALLVSSFKTKRRVNNTSENNQQP